MSHSSVNDQKYGQPVKRIALVGNPNIGKTTLFNKLCGLNQKTGNYPGVTIDKKRGKLVVNGTQSEIIDLPGINSLFPNSKDEELVVDYLLTSEADDFPDVVVVVASAINLKKNLYLFEQLSDLEIPLILAVNMNDLAIKRGIEIDSRQLSEILHVPVVMLSARTEEGISELKNLLGKTIVPPPAKNSFAKEPNLTILTSFTVNGDAGNLYKRFLNLTQDIKNQSDEFIKNRSEFIAQNNISVRKWKVDESILRYRHIDQIIKECVTEDKEKATDFTTSADRLLLHPLWGYVCFAFILTFIFQSVFWLAAYPMDWIESGFAMMSEALENAMPEGYLSQLITEGLIPGIGGVVIFVPQIAILFFLFSILEESGYMPRIVYLMDRLMQRFGMSGKSIVPLISGFACAVPAILSARTIENKKERLITILITPLLTCSARIPVYIVIIGIVVPDETIGIFDARGIALTALYFLGVLISFLAAFIFNKLIRNEFKSYLILEMPEYLLPGMKDVLLTVWSRVKDFLFNAGKIIIATSIVLFVLATNGLSDFKNAESYIESNYKNAGDEEKSALTEARKLETSFLGMIGHSIEPVIKPLGYDWKIGIAIISSLSAREVFVGTVSTIYSIGSEDEGKITDRLRNEKDNSGNRIFNLATCVSLLLFYAFSLQCFSTIAVTLKETRSMKWTLIQFVYMSGFAYIISMLAYQILK